MQDILPKSRLIKIWLKTLNKIIPNNVCKAIVVHGSTIGNSLGLRLQPCILYCFNTNTNRESNRNDARRWSH
jgi:hypothetical protein